MKIKFGIYVSAAFVALALIGCKPTENNYKKAYDAAVLKRQKAAEEQMRPSTGLLSDDGPLLRVVNGDTIYVLSEPLRQLDGTRLPGTWALAIGAYKMDTNAKASARDMVNNGYQAAVAAKGAEGKYYTVIMTSTSLDSVRNVSIRFKKAFPEYPYVGLPGAPVLISH